MDSLYILCEQTATSVFTKNLWGWTAFEIAAIFGNFETLVECVRQDRLGDKGLAGLRFREPCSPPRIWLSAAARALFSICSRLSAKLGHRSQREQ